MADHSDLLSTIADTGGMTVAVSKGTAGPHGVQRALKLVEASEIDAIVFTPLNKSSLKKAGMTEENKLRWFAKQLKFDGTTSEINAIELLNKLRREPGIESPRLGVCTSIPLPNGENGALGRQEIDHIRPTVEAAQAKGIDAQALFPCDTIFLKRQHFDGIVTMRHDQGQIAINLLAFEGGVTMQGGLPIPVSTPAHGKAFDMACKNVASIASTQNAFDTAVTMAEGKSMKLVNGGDVNESTFPIKSAMLPNFTILRSLLAVKEHLCCHFIHAVYLAFTFDEGEVFPSAKGCCESY
ncbi:4-hydroxythreonine-4-phosphate dehydrogenase [Xylariaceae sp. FL0255]|nr:4-hydroxythreonine-4-phosphate dehydrogenase [Xylariaceae sp. FL0255]